MEFRENLSQMLKTRELRAKFGQLFQGCICTAAAIEESVDLIHELPQCLKVRTASGKLENLLVLSLT